MKTIHRITSLLFGVFVMAAPIVQAATCTFSSTSGSWDTPANWSGCTGGNGTVPNTPGPADTAIINNATVNLAGNTYPVSDLQMQPGAIIQGVSASSSSLNVLNSTGAIPWGGLHMFNSVQVNLNGTVVVAPMGITTFNNAVVNISSTSSAIFAVINVDGALAEYYNSGAMSLIGNLSASSGGRITNNSGGSITLGSDLTLSGNFSNEGTLTVPSGRTLTLANANLFSQNGATGQLDGNGNITSAGQTINLSGAVEGSLSFTAANVGIGGGKFSPSNGGSSIGIITVNGNMTFGPSGNFEFDIAAGATVPTFDRLVVTGTLTLDPGSSTDIYYVDDGFGTYAPMSGDTFNVISAASVSGVFGTQNGPGGPNSATLNYPSMGVQLAIGPVPPSVTNTNDSGPGSLRAALNALGGCDFPTNITFDLGMAGGTIRPLTPLPQMNCGSLDGYSHPGAVPNSSGTDWNATLKVTIDGSMCMSCSEGILIGGSVSVSGINFTNWPIAIRLTSMFASNLNIAGNYFFQSGTGVMFDGAGDDVKIGDSANLTGRNVFVHSTGSGIRVQNFTRSTPPIIENNIIGFGAGGTAGPNVVGVLVDNSNGVQLRDNAIANNGRGLVVIGLSNGVSYKINNKFFANTTQAVDLDNDGATANDEVMPPYDTDTGANGRQNYPVITSAMENGGNIDVALTLKSLGGINYAILICGSNVLTEDQCKSGAFIQIQATDMTGLYTGTISVPKTGLFVPPARITAFACPTEGGGTGNCSEISPGVNVLAATPAINVTGTTTFPSTSLNALSAFQTITITNTGSANLSISAISNSNSAAFFDTTGGAPPQAGHYCGFGSNMAGVPLAGGPIVIAPMATCQLNIAFKAIAVGANTANIVISSNDPMFPTRSVTLTGTGLAAPPAVALGMAPATVAVGGTALLTITLTTPSAPNDPLTMGAVATLPAGLAVAAMPLPTTTCGTTVTASGQNISFSGGAIPTMPGCTITVPVTPAVAGSYSVNFAAGALTTSKGTNAAAASTALTATNTPTMTAAFAPATVLTNTNSTLTLTLSNPNPTPAFMPLGGVVNMPIGLVIASLVDNCGASASINISTVTTIDLGMSGTIPAMGSCTITVQAQSNIAGAYTVTVNPGNLVTALGNNTNTSTATLTVTTPAPTVVLSNASLGFGSRTVNTTSPAQTVTLTNGGTANLVITSITSSGDFGYTTTCPIATPPIAPAAPACNINITFTPLTVGALMGSVTIVSNAPSSPHVILLTGTGAPVAVPGILLSASTLNLGGTVVNTSSAQQSIIVTNTGFATLNLTAINVTGGGFARVAPSTGSPVNCGASVAPSSTCQIAIACTPPTVATITGQVTITHNATGSPTNIALSCTGTPLPVATLVLTPSVSFIDQIVNNTSAAQSVTLQNTGTAPLNVSAITITGTNANQFAQTGQCATVAPGASCTLLVTFTPTSVGAKMATLSITSDAQNATAASSVALTGTGVLAPRPLVTLSLTAIGYGNSIFGGASNSQSVQLKNEGGLPLNITSITAAGDFTVSNNCGASVASLGTCTITVAFTPLGIGGRSGEFIIVSNAEGSPHRVVLSGTGCRWFSQSASRFFLTSCGN